MRDLRCIAGWLLGEAGRAWQYAREPQLWAALACGLALWALAYQAPFTYQLDIGGSQATGRQRHDEPFLSDFNASEPASLYDTPAITPYRWTKAHSEIVLPGIGGQRWRVAVRATSGRPDGSPTQARWDAGAGPVALQIDGLPGVYYLQARPDAAGDLHLTIDAPPLPAPADKRTLGMVLYRVAIEPSAGPYLPAPRQLALLAGMLALLYGLARRLVWGPRGALLLALLAAGAGGLLLVFARMALALASPPLFLTLAGCYLLALPASALYEHVTAPGGASARPLVVAIVLLALAVRLAGVLHPYAIFSDLGLNRHNLQGVAAGELYFTEGLPSESGGGQAPYPPGQYLILAPALLALPGDDSTLDTLLKVGNALADSLVAGLIWYLLWRSGYAERAALLGAALYVLPGPILKSLSVGELANVFGQALALPVLVYAAVNARRVAAPRAWAGLVALLGLALLGHLGVTISLFGLLAWLVLAWLARPALRPAARSLVLAGLLVGVFVTLFYYTALLDVLLVRRDLQAPATAALSLGQKLRNDLSLTQVLRLSPLLVALGAAGATLAAFRGRRWAQVWPRPAFGTLLLAWWGGTMFSLGLLLFASQGVRWQAFFYPALCLGGGPALAQLWDRGRAGRAAVIGAAGFLLWNGLDFWITQIYSYLH